MSDHLQLSGEHGGCDCLHVSNYLRFPGENGDCGDCGDCGYASGRGGCCGDFGPTIFNLLVHMPAVVVTFVRLSLICWWIWQLWWCIWSNPIRVGGENNGGRDGNIVPTLYTLVVNTAAAVVVNLTQPL